jgi:hypothetical protein
LPGSSNSLTSISITSCHNSGANTTHRKLKIFFNINTELFLATDAGEFFNFKNRCTLLVRAANFAPYGYHLGGPVTVLHRVFMGQVSGPSLSLLTRGTSLSHFTH